MADVRALLCSYLTVKYTHKPRDILGDIVDELTGELLKEIAPAVVKVCFSDCVSLKLSELARIRFLAWSSNICSSD